MVDMVFKFNDTSSDNRSNTENVIAECIVREDGLLQRLDPTDDTEFSLQGRNFNLFLRNTHFKFLSVDNNIVIMEMERMHGPCLYDETETSKEISGDEYETELQIGGTEVEQITGKKIPVQSENCKFLTVQNISDDIEPKSGGSSVKESNVENILVQSNTDTDRSNENPRENVNDENHYDIGNERCNKGLDHIDIETEKEVEIGDKNGEGSLRKKENVFI